MSANHPGNPLFTGLLGGVQQNINIAIMLAIPCEVVVCWVRDGDTIEVEKSEEMLEHDYSVSVVFIDIAVTSYKNKSVRVKYRPVLKTSTEVSECRDELLVSPTCWKIQGNMDGFFASRNLKEYRGESWSIYCQDSNKRIQFFLPENKGTAQRFAPSKS